MRQITRQVGCDLINLLIAVCLGLGGCEAYPGVFQPFGSYRAGCTLGGGTVQPSDDAVFGLEEKQLARVVEQPGLGARIYEAHLAPSFVADTSLRTAPDLSLPGDPMMRIVPAQ